jgi:hypothetical protein
VKKVLIISYYWPPSGGIGVLRCLKIAKYLREYGWEPVIFTADNAHYPTIDEDNFKDIHPDTHIIKQKIWEPYSLFKYFNRLKKDANVNNVFSTHDEKMGLMYKISVWIRSNFFIPDARAMWIKPSVKKLTKYIKENPVDAIFSDGPPHSNTRIATLVSQKTGIPWLADFQDPWSQVDYFAQLRLTKWGLKKHLKYEQEAFQQASEISIVSPSWKEDLEELGASDVDVVYWGYDPDDYQTMEPVQDLIGKFSLLHAGIMGHDRNPENMFEAIAELQSENETFAKDFRLVLLGQVDHHVRQSIAKHKIESMVEFRGSVSRKEALQAIFSTRMLLLLLNQQPNAKGRIPGKLFEYLAARRPVLNFGPINSDVANLLTESVAGHTFDYSDKEGVKSYLKNQYDSYLSGKINQELDSNISEFTHNKITGIVAEKLTRMTS